MVTVWLRPIHLTYLPDCVCVSGMARVKSCLFRICRTLRGLETLEKHPPKSLANLFLVLGTVFGYTENIFERKR